MRSILNLIKSGFLPILLVVSFISPLAYVDAYYYLSEPHLYIPGVDGAVYSAYVSTGYQPKPVVLNLYAMSNSSANSSGSNNSTSNTPSNSSSNSIFGNLFGSISSNTVAKDADGNPISLVSPDNTHVYAIIAGKKHLIPTEDVFGDYGYTASMVKTISQKELDHYPRADLIKVKNDSKHLYFLTENNMTRLIPSQKVMDSYGDRAEDAITISKQEFNFYPQNQYIYLESPLNRDVFQIVNGTGKRYLTPMAVQRLVITPDQVAPVNQTEMDFYKILAPVIQ
jgi:hypothetical protein